MLIILLLTSKIIKFSLCIIDFNNFNDLCKSTNVLTIVVFTDISSFKRLKRHFVMYLYYQTSKARLKYLNGNSIVPVLYI